MNVRKLIVILGFAAVHAVSAAAQELKVMSFNIRYATANDGADAWPNRKDMLVGLLRRETPDVIGIQEGLYLQLGEIRAALPVYGGIGVGRDDGALAGEFSAILYRRDRFDIVNSGTFWFSDTPEVPGSTSWGNTITRICTWAWLREISTGRRFYIYNVHLDHQSQESRVRSTALLAERIAQRADTTVPVIITGDFNAGESNPASMAITALYPDTYRRLYPREQVVGTFHAFRGDSTGEKIDYILTEPATTVLDARILRDRANGRYPSDHFPVTATLRLSARELATEGGEMEGIVVTATRNERRVEDQPMRVEVVEPEEVEEKVAMTPGDIAMLLNETGGLRVQNTGPGIGASNVRIHGLRGRYTQILADGLPLYGEAGAINLLQIPPLDLLQVEIVKGAVSALYGPSALGGLVNLVSRRPVRTEAELLINGTTEQGGDAVFFGMRPLGGPWGATFLAGAHGQSRRDVDADGWADLPGYRRVVVRPRVFFDDRAGRRMFLTLGFTGERREGGTMEGRTAPDGSPFGLSQTTRRFDIGVSGTRTLASGLAVSGRVSGMRGLHRHVFGSSVETDAHSSFLAELAVSRSGERSSWLMGVATPLETFRSDSVPVMNFDHSAPALFGQLDVAASERLAIQVSGRIEQHSKYGFHASPRASLLWRATPIWSLRLSGGLGYFAPTPLVEETEAVGLRPVAPRLPFRAERGSMLSADVGGALGAIELNATVFVTTVRAPLQVDLQTCMIFCPGQVDSLVITNGASPMRAAGVDLVAKLMSEPWHIVATWTLTDATEVCVTCPNPVRHDVPMTPRHTAGIVVAWEKDGWRVGYELYYTGRQHLDQSSRTTPDYVVSGALVQKELGHARLFVNFENLGDTRMSRRGPVLRPAYSNRTGWTTEAWGPLEGRVINGGVRLSL